MTAVKMTSGFLHSDQTSAHVKDLNDLSNNHSQENDLKRSRAWILANGSDLTTILQSDSLQTRYARLLARRTVLTEELAHHGLCPPLLYQRALTYDLLGYADLAVADAFVVYTVCETVRSDEWISDLEPVGLNNESWPPAEDMTKNLATLVDALALICKSLIDLGCTEDASEKFDELVDRYGEQLGWTGDRETLTSKTRNLLRDGSSHIYSMSLVKDINDSDRSKTGYARREIYPWNSFEPDRNTAESLSELNTLLSDVAPNLEAKVTALPALSEDGNLTEGIWYQLGLFAKKDLPPGDVILAENSLLTAIRPLDDALCDACGADLESTSRDTMRQCLGQDCDTTFCSETCATRAAQEYHNPNLARQIEKDTNDSSDVDTESRSDYPPAHAPLCSNTALQEIGRTSSTTMAEWDLYFLLLTRTIQMSLTQQIHPLSLPSTKYLWGDFNAPPPISSSSSRTTQTTTTNPKSTLPWSLYHNISLPLQYFETLMHSDPQTKPYSPFWLENYDWWMQTTLLAKFRGVANAQQSTFDGKAEIAAVHPLWCLANHSCRPNVTWTPTGTRVFRVIDDSQNGEEQMWRGIKMGEEIWSHYTDVRLPVKKRRERLMEVLGGVCKCPRCLSEADEQE